ncbi:uncharacterized protein METZ01_LOCUS208767 [marine metagenome]|uniref:SHOCT domain-containing protein n=1 Tax=marine metagenome TaxID=408172 RepID=A0A382F119_9ZZZZ
MNIRAYAAILLVVTTVLITTGMQAAAISASDPAGNTSNHDSNGNWETVLLADGTECEGMVFESAEEAKQEAVKIGCSGYHEHHKDDGTVVYMPCTLVDVDIEDVKAQLLDEITRGELTQEQFDEKLAWLEAKARG